MGSIVSLDNKEEYIGIDEFVRYMFYPLLLRYKMPSSGELMRTFFSGGLQFQHSLFNELNITNDVLTLKGNRHDVLCNLRDHVANLNFSYAKTTWSEYHPPDDWNNTQKPNREVLFDGMIKALKPKTVVDIGANAGYFSKKCAEYGAEVLSIDSDEAAISRQYRYIRGTKLSVKTAVGSFGQKINKPAELVLGLALTHHLYISQRYPWSYIAETLASYTNYALLTEFMPNGLLGTKVPEYLPPNYSLNAFREQLQRFFEQVEVIEYNTEGASPRIYLLCKTKKTYADNASKPSFYFGLST